MRQHVLRRTAFVLVCAVLVFALPGAAMAAQERSKKPNNDGSVPKKWDLEKPPVVAHPDEAPETAGGNGDGRNNLSFTMFDTGDMIVALGTLTGHAGIWDDARYRGSIYDWCVWSANTRPLNGVQLEQPAKYQYYDYAYGIWVPSRYLSGTSVVSYCAAQAGEPFNINSSKTNTSEWYCSKLPWKGWQVRTGLDLDADGGYWVWPVDLVNDSETRVFAYSD